MTKIENENHGYMGLVLLIAIVGLVIWATWVDQMHDNSDGDEENTACVSGCEYAYKLYANTTSFENRDNPVLTNATCQVFCLNDYGR